jgi:hypothetical protein
MEDQIYTREWLHQVDDGLQPLFTETKTSPFQVHQPGTCLLKYGSAYKIGMTCLGADDREGTAALRQLLFVRPI